MDTQSRASEPSAESALLSVGTPLPCYRTMPIQSVTAWSPAAFIGALLMAVLAVPRALVLAPAVISRNRRA